MKTKLLIGIFSLTCAHLTTFAHLTTLAQTPAGEVKADTLTTEQQVAKNTAAIEAMQVSLGKLGSLKFSGYIQAQWQLAEEAGASAFADGGNFGANIDNRFSIRRGRIKLTYTKDIVTAVIQPDFTEKGVSIKDAYVGVATRNKTIGGQVGVFDRPFGYEISYSSSLRESPERSRVFQSLFPGERDLGAMLILKGSKGWLSQFSLNMGLFNGNGIGLETDSKKDFIGRLAWLKKYNNSQVGAAFSYYHGGVMNPTENNFRFTKNVGFESQITNKGSYAKREYFGLSAQYIQSWGAGVTNIRAEYLWGSQPGIQNRNNSPGGTSFGVGTAPLYLRQFSGAYAILVQDIGQSKHSAVLKYDYYDPNTQVSGNEIGLLANTGSADIAYSTFGVGYLFRWNQNLRLMTYYNFVNNERTTNLATFSERVKENILTVRMQVKF